MIHQFANNVTSVSWNNHFEFFKSVIFRIQGGELFERVIDDDFVLTERSCAVFMRQICEGIEFVHSQHILHLDMKVKNILSKIFRWPNVSVWSMPIRCSNALMQLNHPDIYTCKNKLITRIIEFRVSFHTAGEHSVLDQGRQQNKDYRLWASETLRSAKEATGIIRDTGVRRAGSGELR